MLVRVQIPGSCVVLMLRGRARLGDESRKDVLQQIKAMHYVESIIIQIRNVRRSHPIHPLEEKMFEKSSTSVVDCCVT